MIKKKMGIKLKNKLQYFKDVMSAFGNARQQFFFSQKRGSIAIEGGVCTFVVFLFLAAMFDFFEVYNQTLLAVRLTEDLGVSVYNGRNITPAFLQGLVNEVMSMNGVTGSSASVYTMLINGSWLVRSYSYGGGCAGPNYGETAGGQFLSSLVRGISGGSDRYVVGWPNVVALAEVTVCVPPPPLYLNWAMFGNYNMSTQQAAVMVVAIPKPPKHK